MKRGSFRRVNFTMERGSGYGQYVIEANYKGKHVVAHTTDSEAWDFLEDDSNREMKDEARRHCYYKIVTSYDKLVTR